MKCQRQMLNIHWWDHITNVEVLQRTGLSTISEILRNRRLSLFGHVARLDPEVPPNRKPSSSWTRPPGRPRRTWFNLVQDDANAIPLSSLYGELRFPGVMGRRNGPQLYAKMTMMIIFTTVNS